MKTPATSRVGTTHPDEPNVGVIGLACRIHEQECQKIGWLVRDYDGPGSCTFCEKEQA